MRTALQVRALDALGNADATPAEHRWTVEEPPAASTTQTSTADAAPAPAPAPDQKAAAPEQAAATTGSSATPTITVGRPAKRARRCKTGRANSGKPAQRKAHKTCAKSKPNRKQQA